MPRLDRGKVQAVIRGRAFSETVVPGVPAAMSRLSTEGKVFSEDTGEQVIQLLEGQASREDQEFGYVPEDADSNGDSRLERPEKHESPLRTRIQLAPLNPRIQA